MKNDKVSFVSAMFIITGNSVGSGLLALPICVGLAGFLPAIAIVIIGFLTMTSTGLIIASIVNKKQDIDFDIPSLFQEYLGKTGKWIAILANLVILYGLIVAYLAGLTEILSQSLGLSSVPYLTVYIFILITFINFFAVDLINKSNAIFVIILLFSFMVLTTTTSLFIKGANYQHLSWAFLPLSLPVVVNSFNFHNTVPTVCKLLQFNKRKVIYAILAGATVSFLLNLIWCIAVIGVMSFNDGSNNSFYNAYKLNLPATIPLGNILLNSITFKISATVFAICAILTSYWTVGLSLMGFIKDLRKNLFAGHEKIIDPILTFIPPLIITLIFPNTFIFAQNIIGGIGIGILFGFLPSLILFLRSKNTMRLIALLMMIFFLSVSLLVALNSSGFITYF